MHDFEKNGFLLLKSVVDEPQIGELIESINSLVSSSAPGVRHLLRRCRTVRKLARSATILNIASKLLGRPAKPVKAIFFDKTPAANWFVTWHQDLTIAVKQRVDLPDFGPWSTKDGFDHVQPPANILENMLSIRIHLDDCPEENGAIRFFPGTHLIGKLSSKEISSWRDSHDSVSCPASAGDAIVMRPLILHSSPKATHPEHRRILHIEFAGTDLPGGLEWSEASGLDSVELVGIEEGA